MAGIGYLGIGHEEAYGGMNLDLISQAIAGEAVASACASTFLSCEPPVTFRYAASTVRHGSTKTKISSANHQR